MRNSAPLQHGERSGLLFALAGFALLSFGDAVVKTMAGEWPPTAVAALRYTAGAIGLSALLLRQDGRKGFAMPHPRVQVLRGFGVALATVGFFSAIFVMPLATATTIAFSSPMLTALLAAIFLKEPARRETWIATGLAFIGVVVVLRPNLGAIGLSALLPLLAAFGMSLLMIGNRFVAGTASVLAMQVFVAAIASPILIMAAFIGDRSGVAGLVIGMPDWSVVVRCVLVACSATMAHWLIFVGTTRSGAASIAPMTYIQLLVATALGWVWFGNRPDGLTLLGAAIIVGAGLYLWRAGRVREPAMTD